MSPKIHLWALAVCGGLVYANALSGPFVFDDEPAIARNPDIRQLWPPIWAVTSEGLHAAVNSRPLTSLTLALNYALGGLAVEGYRLVNIGLHMLCGLALYGVLRLLFGRIEALAARSSDLAFCTALLWLVHPLNSQAVHYIVQRSASLMALCYLGTLYGFLRGVDDRRWLWVSAGCCGLGMMAKEVMVGAPLVVLICDGLFVSGSYRVALGRRKVYYGGLALTWLLLARGLWSAPHGATIGFDRGVDAWTYLLNQAQMIVTYLRLSLWPHPLALDYGYPRDLALGDVWLEGVLVLGLVLLSGMGIYRHRRWGFVGALALIALAPTSSFVPLVNEVGAERRMYLPLAALAAGLVVAVDAWCGRWINGRRVGLALCGCAGLALAVATLVRNGDYASEVTIWESAAAAVADNPRAHYNLAKNLTAAGATARAVDHYRRAVALKPDYGAARNNLGLLLVAAGDAASALEHYRYAIATDPEFGSAHVNLGLALAALGRAQEALPHYRRGVELEPASTWARYNLGLALAAQGQLDEAIAHYRWALGLDPGMGQAHYQLGLAYATTGQGANALYHLRAALARAPDHPRVHFHLGRVLGDMDSTAAAARHLRRAVELDPELAAARARLEAAGDEAH